MKRLNLIHAMLFALVAICLLTQPISVLANGDDGDDGCPLEGLPAETWYSINENDIAFIYGYTSVSNLSYWPNAASGPYITSDHDVYSHHYYEDEDFDVYYAFRLAVDENPHWYQANPRYFTNLGEFDPEQAMPEDYLSDWETLSVNVYGLLPSERTGKAYHMSAYTRIDAYYGPGKRSKFSWKDCQNSIEFWHTRPRRQ